MKVFHSPEHVRHAPETFMVAGARKPIPEVPDRVARLLGGIDALGLTVEVPPEHGPEPLARVHTPEYLDFLQTIHDEWQRMGGSEQVVPNVHPIRRDGTYPASPTGRAGYHQADTSCPIVAGTWDAARRSADAAISAARAVLDGDPAAYALCRPPGHHAFADVAGGFCYLNNAAIAARVLRRAYASVAILDIDLHHGNGTQGIFYRSPDVFTASVHVDPAGFYPFFWGHANERGEADGFGYNLNMPLPTGSGDTEFLQALDTTIDRLAVFMPGVLVLALGLDASVDDPFGGLRVTRTGFEQIGKRIAAFGKPVVLVQEGGYVSDTLGDNLQAFLAGFMEA